MTQPLLNFLEHFTSRAAQASVTVYVPGAEPGQRGSWKRRDGGPTPDDLQRHLQAAAGALSVFPVAPGSSETRLAVLDVDDHKRQLAWGELCQQGLRLHQELGRRGYDCWPCRSGSGHGLHLWLLWEQPQPAAGVRRLLQEVRAAAQVDPRLDVEVFPKQDRVEAGEHGGAVALPLGRLSRPVTHLPAAEVAEDLGSWLTVSPPVNQKGVAAGKDSGNQKRELKKRRQHGPADLEHVVAALGHLDPDSENDQWVQVGMGLKHAEHEGRLPAGEGLRLWDEWSRKSPKYKAGEPEQRWRTFKNERGGNVATLDTVLNLAKKQGWREPKARRDESERQRDGDAVLELNDQYFVCDDQGDVSIYREVLNRVGDIERQVLLHYSPGDFKFKFLNRRVVVDVTARGHVVTEDLGTAWFKSEARRQYERFVLRPDGLTEEGDYNLWRGWAVEPDQEAPEPELFKQHLRQSIAGGDQQVYEYLLNWCSRCVQQPMRRGEVAIVLRGERGVGKGTFAGALGELFNQHYLQLFSTRDLVGRFNSHLRDCIVLYADEAVWAANRQDKAVLDGMVSEPDLVIEQKGKDIVKCPNMLHLIIATNNEWSVPAGLDERRFLALKVGNEHKQDLRFFKQLRHELYDQNGRARWLWELLNRDLSGFEVRDIPQTAELADQKIMSLKIAESWWLEKLTDGQLTVGWPRWDEPVPVKALYMDYVQFCRAAGQAAYSGSTEHLSRKIQPFLPGVFESRAQRLQRQLTISPSEVFPTGYVLKHWVLPPLDACRQCWDKKGRFTTEWLSPVAGSAGQEGGAVASGPDEPEIPF